MKTFSLSVLLFSLLFFSQVQVNAQENENLSLTPHLVISEVSLINHSQSPREINASFVLYNQKPFSTLTLFPFIEFQFTDKTVQTARYSLRKTLTLAAEEKITIREKFFVPSFMRGEIKINYGLANAAGNQILLTSLGEVKIDTVPTDPFQSFIAISNCSYDGKALEESNAPPIIIEYKSTPKSIVCNINNGSQKELGIGILGQAFHLNYLGRLVPNGSIKHPTLLPPMSEVTIEIPLPTSISANPGYQIFSLYPVDQHETPLMKPVFMYYKVTPGTYVEIFHLDLEKNKYQPGETAQVNYDYAITTDRQNTLIKYSVAAQLFNEKGSQCHTQAVKLDLPISQRGPHSISIPVDSHCNNPRLSLSILDFQDQIVASAFIQSDKAKQQNSSPTSTVTSYQKIIIISIVLLLITIGGIFIYVKKQRGGSV